MRDSNKLLLCITKYNKICDSFISNMDFLISNFATNVQCSNITRSKLWHGFFMPCHATLSNMGRLLKHIHCALTASTRLTVQHRKSIQQFRSGNSIYPQRGFLIVKRNAWRKAAGIDQIPAMVIRSCAVIILPTMTMKIIKNSLSSGVYLDQCSKQIIFSSSS